MIPFRALVAAIAFTILSGPASAGTCPELQAVFKKQYPGTALDQPDFRADLAAAERACDNIGLRLWINDAHTVASAKPIRSVTEAEGVWVNDYWLTVMLGVSVPYVDTLEIAADGTLTQRWWRWTDPAGDMAEFNPDAIRAVPDLMPAGLTGRIERVADGVARIADAKPKTVAYAYADPKRPELGILRSRQIVAARPLLSGDLRLAVTGDRMAVTGTDGVTRTYRRHDKRDVRRIRDLIRVAEVSAGQTWRCLLLQIKLGGSFADKLRQAGDYAIEYRGLLDGFEKQRIDAHNAKIRTGKATPPDRTKMKAGLDRLKAMQDLPIAQWIARQVSTTEPFGCKRLFR